jgi:hypothetical protein
MQTSLTIMIAMLGKLIAGLQKHPPPAGVTIDGKSYTAAQVEGILQPIIDAMNAAVAAKAMFLETAHASDAAYAANQAFVRDLKQTLQITYGSQASTLADFGLTPRKKPTMTAAEKAEAAVKAAATRKARNTMGAKQKAKITGATPVATTQSPTPVPAAVPVPGPVTGSAPKS